MSEKNYRHLRRKALKMAAIYAIFGVLWIAFSDQLLHLNTADIDHLVWLQTLKGWFFVMLSAGLFFFMALQALREKSSLRTSARATEDRYHAVFDGVNEAIFLHDLETGELLDVNAKALDLFGYPKERMLGMNVEALSAGTPPYTQKEAAAWMEKARQGETPRFEWRSRRRDGTLFFTEVHMRRADLLGRPVLMVTARDIEGRKQTEAALRESEARYRSLAELSPDGILVNVGGRFAYANEAACRILRAADPGEIIGRDPFAFIDPAYHDGVRARIRRILEQKIGNSAVDQRWRAVDGTPVDLGVSAAPLLWEGRPAVQVLLRDISERKQAEENLIVAKAAAEDAACAKGQFLANMSHEIRTPLNGLFGMLQYLQTTPLQPEQAECLAVALDSGQSLLRILNDILDLSRIEAGKLQLAQEPLHPAEILRDVTVIFNTSAADKGISLIGASDSDLPAVIGDPGRIRQVLFNLVGNAVKFTDEGQVRIAAHARPEERDPERLLLTFTVTDTGVGIPPEKLGDIFEPFTQVDATQTRRHGGSGLGLGIVKRLIELMQGQVEIDSEPGKGTTVQVTIPALLPKDAAQRPMPVTGTAETSVARPLNILVAEDDRINRLMLERLLTRHGHRIVAVSDGRQCLQALEKEDFDLILMDIQMPEIDGMEATQEIRKRNDAKRDIPIIAITAHAMQGDREKFIAAGVDECLSKPVEWPVLKRALALAGQKNRNPR